MCSLVDESEVRFTRPLDIELTILMPCLNEAETIGACIAKAQGFLFRKEVAGEVLIADNGSTDSSPEIARSLGARIVKVPARGYGAALLGGVEAARGRYVVMGDADDSYDFSRLDGYLDRLRDGAELVMGNRFQGGIDPGAMPFLHKYLGNPVSVSLAGCSSRFLSATFTAACALSGRSPSAHCDCRPRGWSSRARWLCAPRCAD